MAILDLKSNLSQWRKPTTVESAEKKKLSEASVKAVYSTSNELKTPTDIKINKVDNSTSIQVPGAKKIDYKLFSINAKRNKGIPAISKFFGSSILDKESLFKKFIPGNIVKVSEYKEQRVKEINKVSEFIKITPRGIQHISTIEILKTILKDKLSLYKDQLPINILKLSLYKDQLPIDILKLSLYKDQLPAIIDKLSLYKDQIPNILGKLSLYKDQRPNMLAKISQYIQKLIDNKNSIYDTRKEILGFKNVSDRLRLLYRATYPPVFSNFNDLTSGARGFTRNQTVTQYLGLDTNSLTYTYPKTVKFGNILNRSTFFSDTKQGYLIDGTTIQFKNVLANTKFYRAYNTDKSPYTDKNSFLTNIGNSLKSYAETRRSPSPLDIEYTKFNLRTASFNPFSFGPAFDQPLILRGIQREKIGDLAQGPQSWGFRNNFDDGLIRGGIVGSTERAIFDTIRIGKWMASPKGLLFIVKQAGLQASAPNTEADPLVGKRASNGALTLISSLANTATQHLGLRFRKDAVPFVPRTTYSSVIFGATTDNGRGITPVRQIVESNRLANLKYALLDVNAQNARFSGMPLISGLGGPQSVYGIGATNIRRVVNSRDDLRYNTVRDVRVGIIGNDYSKDKQYTNGAPLPTINNNIPYNRTNAPSLYILGAQAPSGSGGFKSMSDIANINGNYYTLSFPDIIAKAKASDLNTTKITNFLLNDSGQPLNTDIANIKWIPTQGDFQGTVIQDYTQTSQHIRKKLRVPEYGKRGKNLQNPLEGDFMKVYKNDFGMIDPIWKINQTDEEAVDDFIKFMFHDLNTNERFRFRAYIENVSEDFNPQWQEVKILGRADSPYIYQGFERNLSISFKAAALSRGDLMLMWDQLERLAKTTVPKYDNTYKMKGPLIKFTLGNWFINTPAFIKSLSYTVDNDTPWEINLSDSGIYRGQDRDQNVGELPMTVSIQVSMQIFGEVRPETAHAQKPPLQGTITEDKHYNKGNLYPLGSAGLRAKRQANLKGVNDVELEDSENETVDERIANQDFSGMSTGNNDTLDNLTSNEYDNSLDTLPPF